MKRPAFQFYPADWRKDVELGSCGYVARGLWWEMLCVMHECAPYGHLSRNGSPIPDKSAAELTKVPLNVYRKAISELELNGVFSRLDDGTIFSRRMVRDERIRDVRAAAGRLGGNPTLVSTKDKQNAESRADLLNHASNLELTPSSSSSSSSSSSKSTAEARKSNGSGHGSRLPDDWKLPDAWRDWAIAACPEFDSQRVVRISLNFRDHWIAKPGKDGRKSNWLATWRKWVRTEAERG